MRLRGEVEWQYQKDAAENAARHLSGVRGVINQISVKPRVSPGELTAGIENAFSRSAGLDAGRITVEADGDKATLRGTVRSWAERDEAEREAWSAHRVSRVENRITVEPA